MNKLDETSLGPALLVTRPLLPDLDDLAPSLRDIWDRKWVTNNGPYVRELQVKISDYLHVPHTAIYNNGTTALIAALKIFDLPAGSEVITTPFTFPATAHAIMLAGLVPVFADVRASDMTLDPAAVEAAMSARTSAVLPVHVFGHPCDVMAFADIAAARKVRVIYDAAHAFGTEIDGKGIAAFGDASVFSFHATKLFNTIEGGCLVTTESDAHARACHFRNFGILNEDEVDGIGMNGKMNEILAAIGLENLQLLHAEREARSDLRSIYDKRFSHVAGLHISKFGAGVKKSEQYYSIRIDKGGFGSDRDEVYQKLRARNIFARKYFAPICTAYPPYLGNPIVHTGEKPVAVQAGDSTLCLPFHSGISHVDAERVCDTILDCASVENRS